MTATAYITVIVFASDEAADLAPLVTRLDRALGDADPEILLVHDRVRTTPVEVWSTVRTASGAFGAIHRSSASSPRSSPAEPAGRDTAHDQWVVVMDGDRRHPPELVPDLLCTGRETRADLVAARGTVGGARADRSRDATSTSGADRLAATLRVPIRLTDASNPMSGFFVVRRDCLDAAVLGPRPGGPARVLRGRNRRLRVAELRVDRRPVASGGSAAPASTLVDASPGSPGRLAGLRRRWASAIRVLAFAVVGVTGLAVNSVALWGFVDVLGLGLLLSATLATQVSTAWNFVLADTLVFTGPKRRPGWTRFVGFALVNNVVLLLRLPLLSWLVYSVGMAYLWANVLSLLAAFVVRFLISDHVLFRTWSPDDPHAREAVAVRRTRGLHSSAGPAGDEVDGSTWAPGGARDRSDGSRLPVPA